MAKGFIERTRKVFGTRGDQLPGSKYRKAPKRMTSQKADEPFEKELEEYEKSKKAKAKKQKESDDLFEEEKKLIKKSREPRTIRKAPIDKLKSVFPPSLEALERSGIEAPKKTREKFLGLFETDEKQPDFMEEMMSVNKSGGHIKKYNKGGSVRGCGKAMRGYGRANYSKKDI